MKKLLVGFITLSTVSVFAHPGDNELMTQIDLGSKLKIQRDINIPSHNKIIVMNGAEYQFFSQVVGNEPGCRLAAADQNYHLFERDVVVRAGESLTAFKRDSSTRGGKLIFRTEKNNIFSIFCWKSMNSDGRGKGIPTIGQLKKTLGGLASIELGDDPVEL